MVDIKNLGNEQRNEKTKDLDLFLEKMEMIISYTTLI